MHKHKWILLAEDNINDADLASRALAAHGSDEFVVVAHDGVQAMNCLRLRSEHASRSEMGNPSLILLDLKMPRMSGLEVLRQIRADATLRTIPIVIFTTSREPEDVAECYRLGANAYVVKPVGYDELVTVLKETKAFWLGLNEPPPKKSPESAKPVPFGRSRKGPRHNLSVIA